MPQEYLTRHGWKEHSRGKRGGYHFVKWVDPTDGEIIPQGQAVRIQIERNKEQPRARRVKS